MYDTQSAGDLFRPKFLGRSTEAVGLMLLDGRGRLLYNGILAEGDVYKRQGCALHEMDDRFGYSRLGILL